MAVEQPEAKASPARETKASPALEAKASAAPEAEAAPAPQAARDALAEETPAQSDLDEVKRKFREALDRKRGTHASAQGADHTGKVHGSHGPAASRRSFRRKSG
jgi:uncharacterized protein DUF5302